MTSQDQQYPYIETPRLLCNPDNTVNNLFRKELRAQSPEMFEWRWMEGITTAIGTPKEEFKDQMFWHINQRYEVGTGRMVESCERSSAVNFVELGDGYRLHCAGFNPRRMKRATKQIILFDWLYWKRTNQEKCPNDGIRRLRELVKWMNKCPKNPYNVLIFLPVGEEILKDYAPHYNALDYYKTGHSSEDLRKLYKYWLKGVETKLSPNDDLAGNYWRSELYEPENTIYLMDNTYIPEVYLNN